MKKIFNLCAALLMLCVVIYPAKTSAQPTFTPEESMAAFREALMADSDDFQRIFKQDMLFVSPFIQAELNILGDTEKDTFKSAGEFSLWVEDDKGTTTDKTIPFYMTQNGKDMVIYFKADKKWEKFTAPSLAANITDMLATPTGAEIEEIIDGTKEVQILQENENRRIMLITVDGDKMADSLKSRAEQNPDNNDADSTQEDAVNYLDTALRNANIWYMWTIDKRDWHTVALQYQFSGIIQELARAALNDPTKTWPDEISQLLETIAYYSEIRSFITYPANPEAKKLIEVPKNVLKAKEIDSLMSAATK